MQENIEKREHISEDQEKERILTDTKEREINVETRGEAVEKIKATFRQRLEERFGFQGKEPLDFHSPEHSETVASDARAFLEIMRRIDPDLVTEKNLEEAEIEGLAHDLIQDSTKEEGKMRSRHRGWKDEDIPQDLREKGVTIGNERASADELLEEVRRYYLPNKERVFNDEEVEAMAEDIAVTFPKFEFSELPDGTKGLKVWQPYVTPDTRLVGLALSVGDLQGEARISKNPKVFIERGNGESRELNWKIGEAVAGGVENILQEERIEIARKVIGWTQNQVGFIGWQEVLFWEKVTMNKILNASPKREEIFQALREEFSHFDNNRNASEERYRKLKAKYYGESEDPKEQEEKLNTINDEGFKNILREIGYTV